MRRSRRHALLAGAGALVVLAIVAACAGGRLRGDVGAPKRPGGPLVPPTGVLLGAFVSNRDSFQGNQRAMTDVEHTETSIGRPLAIDQHFYGWTDRFPGGLEEWDAEQGRIPLVTWQPGSVDLDDIAAGEEDDVIAARARDLAAFGHPVFLRWGHEMNGNWYSWSGEDNNQGDDGRGPALYVHAWRHVHDVMVAAGATNVVWVWSPGADDVPDAGWNHWTEYYPGDQYVDWVGVDGYNKGGTRDWVSFREKFQRFYDDYAGRKPIMIAEVASGESGGDKAAWIEALRADVKTRFRSVAAVVWFDDDKEAKWSIDSSPAALKAFRQMALDPYFRPAPRAMP